MNDGLGNVGILKAAIAALSPEQTAGGLAVKIIGAGNTSTVMVAVPIHPLISDPVTVYVVVVNGPTVGLAPLKLPGIQEYVIVPPGIAKAAIVPEVPSQIGGGPEANTVGFGVPNKRLVVALHPLASVKVTVYVTPLVTFVKLPVVA